MDLQESEMWGYGLDRDWLTIGRWRALVNAVMNLRVPQNGRNFLINLGTVGFSNGTVLHGVKY